MTDRQFITVTAETPTRYRVSVSDQSEADCIFDDRDAAFEFTFRRAKEGGYLAPWKYTAIKVKRMRNGRYCIAYWTDASENGQERGEYRTVDEAVERAREAASRSGFPVEWIRVAGIAA